MTLLRKLCLLCLTRRTIYVVHASLLACVAFTAAVVWVLIIAPCLPKARHEIYSRLFPSKLASFAAFVRPNSYLPPRRLCPSCTHVFFHGLIRWPVASIRACRWRRSTAPTCPRRTTLLCHVTRRRLSSLGMAV